jgi:hypothetical protein
MVRGKTLLSATSLHVKWVFIMATRPGFANGDTPDMGESEHSLHSNITVHNVTQHQRLIAYAVYTILACIFLSAMNCTVQNHRRGDNSRLIGQKNFRRLRNQKIH